MIKDYVVVDNALEDPLTLRNFLLKQKYLTAEGYNLPGIESSSYYPIEGWRGFRTKELFSEHGDFLKPLLSPVFSNIFKLKFNCNTRVHGHFCPGAMNDYVFEEKKWHTDPSIFAGVIYLNKEPPTGSGTHLIVDGRETYHENLFNRLVFYKSNLLHSPGNFFGQTAQDARLTLTIFVYNINFF